MIKIKIIGLNREYIFGLTNVEINKFHISTFFNSLSLQLKAKEALLRPYLVNVNQIKET
jgi:hypothetical protein